MTRVQRTSSHYAQRPDRTYSPLDPTLTSLGGWSLQSSFERTSGRHWLWGVSTKVDSENFETNDIANLNGADGIILSSNIRYRETRPGRIFRGYTIGFNQSNDSTLRFLRQAGSLRPSVNVTWANFWTSSWSVTRNLPTQERVADPRRSADGRPRELEHDVQRRQPGRRRRRAGPARPR